MIPYIGHIYSIFGSSSVDAISALKFEIEMSLALADYVGFNIDDPDDRRFAVVLACAALEDEYNSDKDASLLDFVESAVSEYSTRQFSKTLAKIVTRAIMTITARRWIKYFPIVGIAVGAAVSFAMSRHTGRECYLTLRRRKKRQGESYSPFVPKPDFDVDIDDTDVKH